MFQRTRFSGACKHVRKVAVHIELDSKLTAYPVALHLANSWYGIGIEALFKPAAGLVQQWLKL